MAEWKVDAKARQVIAPDGRVFPAEWMNDRWRVDFPLSEPTKVNSSRSTFDIKSVDEAQKQWDKALDEGVELLRLAGTMCFGNDWIMPMANLLQVNRTSIHRWVTKERPLTVDHPVWPDVINAVGKVQHDAQNKADALKQFYKNLKTILKQADTFESGRHAGGSVAD